MRILTIGPSPYLLARSGRINKDIMVSAAKKGHHVECLVWHHDVQYFMPNETNKHTFSSEGHQFDLHPFMGRKGEIAAFTFEAMKTTQPQVVVTVGDYDETDFVWSLKSLYPNLFKWIAVVPSGTDTVSEKNRLALSYADRIVVTTKAALKAFSAVKTAITYAPYGPNRKTFHPTGLPPSELSMLNMGKNSQMSNVPAFLKAAAETGVRATLHTNIDDGGDYDIRSLIKRWGIEDKVKLPDKFVSVREGLSDALVNQLYNGHHLIVDCSLQSATALTMLEGMSTGCIPVGMEFGAAGEVLGLVPKDFRFSVPFETFVGPKEEELAIISVKGLVGNIRKINERHLSDPEWMGAARLAAVEAARIFSEDSFAAVVSEILETVVASEHSIAVDSF